MVIDCLNKFNASSTKENVAMYAEQLRGTKKIGRGCFTTAYRKGNKVYAVSRDVAKEGITIFNVTGRHIPKIERLACDVKSLYVMPYYRRCTKREFPKAWNDYQIIKRALLNWYRGDAIGMYGSKQVNQFIDFITTQKQIKKSLRDDIISLVEMMMNYTDRVGFEISPRNIAVNSRGSLVLLDVVYNIKDL